MKLHDAIAKFEVQLKADGRSPHTVSSYLRDLGLLTGFMGGGVNVASVSIEDLNGFFTSAPVIIQSNGKPKAPISINRTKSTIKSFFSFLLRINAIQTNPADNIRIKYCQRKVPDILTDQERKVLFKILKNTKGQRAFRDRIVYSVFLNTGIRLAELVGLNIDDINLPDKRMTITAKGNQEVTKFLNSRVRRDLEQYMRVRKRMVAGTDALFLSNRNERISSRQVQRSFEIWLQAASINKKLTIHSLRHTFASNIYERTHDLVLTQEALGHRQISTTTIYTHLHNNALVDALEAI